jgi:hypothetical protein
MNFERLAIYATLGLLLNALGVEFNTWGFWSMLALFITNDYLARKDGIEQGMWITANLPIEAIKEIQQHIKDIENDK